MRSPSPRFDHTSQFPPVLRQRSMDQGHYDHALEIYKCVLEIKEHEDAPQRPPHLGMPTTTSRHLRKYAIKRTHTCHSRSTYRHPWTSSTRALSGPQTAPCPHASSAPPRKGCGRPRGQCRRRGQEPRGLERKLLARRCSANLQKAATTAAHVAKAAKARQRVVAPWPPWQHALG
jgi:hypothetical protein